MQTSILWQGIRYDSKEHCLIHTSESGVKIDSVIVGSYQNIMYRVEYALLLNNQWETLSFKISSIHNQVIQHLEYNSDGKGNWTDKGEPVPRLQGCIDIDMPLTPLTNSLPINRLKADRDQTNLVQVVYIDLLAEKLSPLTQRYTRSADNIYHYETLPNDFEADITVDEQGFVLDYPELFTRRAFYQF